MEVGGREGGGGGGGAEKRVTIPNAHQNDFCTEMGSDERRCNASFFVRGKVTRPAVSVLK